MASQKTFTSTQQSAYFPALTGVRAIVAFMLFVLHYRPKPGQLPEFIDLTLLSIHVLPFFFILSGFLITYRYEEVIRTREISFRKYITGRIARIYPLYLLLTIIVLLVQGNNSGWEWFLNLTLLKGYFEVEKFTGIAPAWSLTIEETFYLFAPLIFYIFRKTGLISIILILTLGVALVMLAQTMGSVSFMKDYAFMLEYTFFGRAFAFYCGYKLAVFLRNKPQIRSNSGIYTLAGIILIIIIFSVKIYLHTVTYKFPFSISPVILLSNFILPLGISVWFYGLLTEKTWLNHLLNSMPFQILGKSSYAFYLIHAGVFYQFIYANITTNKIVTFIIISLTSISIYYLFEKPVNRYIRQKIDKVELSNLIKL